MRRLLGLAGAAGILAAVSLLAALLWGAGQGQPLPGVQVDPRPLGEGRVMLFADGEAGPAVAATWADSSFLACVQAGPQTVEKLELPSPLLAAAYGPGGFFVVWEQDSLLQVSAFSPGLEQAGDSMVFLPADSLSQVLCSPQGTVYCVAFDTPSLLRCFSWDGQEGQRDFGQDVEGLWLDPGGQLWVRAGERVYVGDAGAVEQLGQISCPSLPIGVVGEGVFCCESGSLWQVQGPEAQLLLQGDFTPGRCWAGPQGILWAPGLGHIARLGLDGSNRGSCQLGGELLALAETSALYTGEDGISCAIHGLFSQEEAPPASSWPAEPQPSWAPAWKEGCVIVPAGALAEELRRLLFPQELEIFTAQGEPVRAGALATGMQAGEWPVVVLGDCDGNGRVTGQDVELAQAMLLEGCPDGMLLLAADMDGDGALTTADLVHMAACVG